MKTIVYKILISCFTLLYASVLHAQLQLSQPNRLEQQDILTVDEAFLFDFEQQDDRLFLKWDIVPGHYIYRDKIKIQPINAQILETYKPEGTVYEDPYFGAQRIYRDPVTIELRLDSIQDNATVEVTYIGCAQDKLCYPPKKIMIPLQSYQLSEQGGLAHRLAQGNIFIALLFFFILGVGLAFTPCVFPMYPILSSIILNHSQGQKAKWPFLISMSYVQGMAVTYSLLGVLVAMAGLKYQAALQQPLLLGVLAALFCVLALSMFDAFNFNMPEKLTSLLNKISSQQKTGTLKGVFIIGALSGLVASPCTTAPLSGALLYIAQTGDIWLGFIALYSLSLGMGLPLLILGTTSDRWLPKAGDWMNIVKKVFGFLLLAVSVTLISRFAPHLLISLLWVFWLLSLISYLFIANLKTQNGTFKLVRFISIAVAAVGLAFLLRSEFIYTGKTLYNQATASQSTKTSQIEQGFTIVHTLQELDTSLLEARKAKQPVLVDMYAQWCVACKEFETITFQDKAIQRHFRKMKLIKVDVTDMNDQTIAILERYDIKGLPTLLLFNSQGQQQEQLRVTGFMAPQEFDKQLQQITQ
tara:strand:- start:3505 stop:5253 length:1749 start_codon:yes stop_codon:yes gene_type:complete